MSRPLPICPVVRGVWLAEKNDSTFRTCLHETFNDLQRYGTQGSAILGATVPLQYLSFFRRTTGGWIFFEEPLRNILDTFEGLRRPLVFQLVCNHLSRMSPLVRELATDPSNLMEFADGSHPHDQYFRNRVIPLSLLDSPELRINRFRYRGLEQVLVKLRDFHERTGLVHGISLFGEAHQLYSDFKYGGGAEGDVNITDFSARSIQEFRRWLSTRFGHSLQALNRELGSRFTEWDQIDPPRSASSDNILDHLDSYAHGQIPVEGWCSPMENIQAVEVWIANRLAGRATLQLSRPDVPENLEEVSDLNTGFRFSFDFRRLPAGSYELRVVAVDRKNQVSFVGQRRITVLSTGGKRPASLLDWPRSLLQKTRRRVTAATSGIQHWLDLPSSDIQVLYNPLADLWNHYRCYQVEAMLGAMWYRAAATGFPCHKLYSHQIMIPYFGRRSEYLYATGATLHTNSAYNLGATLYGGQTLNPKIPARFANRPYAVTEFHPLSGKRPEDHLRALRLHRAAGASWVAPYFLSPLSMENADAEHRRFWIDPTNEAYGSHSLHAAIRHMCVS